jgi:cytochrome P450
MFVLQSLAVALLSLLVAFYANFRWKRRRFYELADKLPMRKGLPFIGVLHKFIFRSYRDYLNVVSEMSNSDEEELNAIYLGPVLLAFINSPEFLKIVLNSPSCQMKPATFYNAWQCEEGLVLSHGAMWKRHRKLFNNCFTINVLREFIPMFNDKAIKSIKTLENYVDKKEFDAYEILAAVSLETLMKGNFNFDRDYMNDPHNEELLMVVER